MSDEMLTIGEAADVAGVTYESVRRWITSGRLKARVATEFRNGGSLRTRWKVRRADLDELLAERRACERVGKRFLMDRSGYRKDDGDG